MMNDLIIQNPFPGLRAFEEHEDILFFGREKQVDELLTKLRTTRFLAVIGSSGSGKSSLVKSGLIPALHSGFMSGAGSLWRICSFRPGTDPIHNMAAALSQVGVLYDDIQDGHDVDMYTNIHESTLRRSSAGLAAAYKQSGLDTRNNLLILVDQFEELFRFSRFEKENKDGKRDSVAFINLLLKAAEQRDVPVYVVFTMRSDFLGDCTEFRGLPEAINQGDYLVPRMTREERKEAVMAPIAVAGATISPRLLNQLLNDVGDNPDQLPILQHALMRTWDIWKQKQQIERAIDLEDYEEAGTMQFALSRHAEEAYAELTTDRQKQICQVLFKALTDKGSDARGIRRPTSLGEICELTNASLAEVTEVIDVFRKPGRSFLMPPAEISLEKESVIDISHESLMRVWERLMEWVDEENRSAEVYRRICEAATAYQRGVGGLLRNPELDIALKWKAQNAPNATWAKRYDVDFERTMGFLDYSRDQYVFEVAQKELQQKKRIKRARLIAVVLGTAAMVCLVFLLISLNLKYKAEESERQAIESKRMAEQESREAIRQKNLADTAKQRAEEQRLFAEEQRTLANEQKNIAEKERTKAEQEKQNALFQRGVAEKATSTALSAKSEAELRKKEAEDQTAIARNERSISEREKLRAEASEKNTRKLRLLALSRTLANQSIREYNSNNQELARLLAAQAYAFNKENDGNEFIPEIFTALSTVTGSARSNRIFEGGVRKVALMGKLMAAGDETGVIRFWNNDDPSQPAQVYRIKGNGLNNIRSLVFNANGSLLVAGTAGGNVYVFNTGNFSQLPVMIPAHKGPVTAISFMKQGPGFYTSSGDSTIQRINFNGNTPVVERIMKGSSRIMGLSLSPDGNRMAAAEENGHLLLLDNLREKTIDRKEILIVKELLKSVTFSNDGRYLACGTADGNIYLFEANRQYQQPQRIKVHQSPVYAITFSDNNQLLATGAGNGEIKVWQRNNFLLEPLVLKGNESWVWDMRFTANNTRLLSVGADKTIRSWVFDQEMLSQQNCSMLRRSFTTSEWKTYIGEDIEQKNVCANQ